MDLDNINDIEVLRRAAKDCRVQLKEDVMDDNGVYTFKKSHWYIVNHDEHYVTIYSDDYNYTRLFTYEEANKYLNCER